MHFGGLKFHVYEVDFFKCLFILREREKEHACGGGAERKGEKESQGGSMLSAHSPMQSSNA